MALQKLVCLAFMAASAVIGKEQIERDMIVPVEVEMVSELQTIEAAPTYECADGATLNADGTCTLLVESKAKHHCPKGYSQSRTGGCVQRNTVAPVSSCPAGVAKGKKCVSYETAPATMECSRGYKMGTAGLCIPDGDSHHAKKHCGKGARLEGDVCVITESVKPEYICDSGNLAGSNCEESETMAPVCRDGFLANGDTCVSTKRSKPESECPKGYSSGRTGECTQKVVIDSETECELGSTLDGRNCVSAESVALEYKCRSKGFELQGTKCVKYLEEEPVASCPKGFKEMDGACVQHHNKRSSASCPPDFELKGSKCIGEEILAATSSCRDGDYLANGECVSSEESKSALYCDGKGYKLQDGLCVKHHSKRATKRCPAGSVEEGHKCIIKSTLAAEQECARGEQLLTGGLCGSTETRAPDFVCPPGYRQASGKGHHDSADSGAMCTKENYSSPTMACPAGFELSGRNCVQEDTISTISECEGGISKGGACMNIVSTKAKPTCEQGFSLKKGVCYKKVRVSVPSVTTAKTSKRGHGHGAKAGGHGHGHGHSAGGHKRQ